MSASPRTRLTSAAELLRRKGIDVPPSPPPEPVPEHQEESAPVSYIVEADTVEHAREVATKVRDLKVYREAKRIADRDEYAVRLAEKTADLKLAREASRLLEAEERGPVIVDEIVDLQDLLAEPDEDEVWCIEGLQFVGSRVVLAAQNKAGKTTMVGNLIRSLADGWPFLGRFTVTPVDEGSIVLLDFEMNPKQLKRWLRALNIRNSASVKVQTLRGAAHKFDIFDPKVRAEWVALFKRHATVYLILDCLGPILNALGLDENRDAGRFLVQLDRLLQESGIPNLMLVHHMGHGAENGVARSRGDSRIRDWPDIEWMLMKPAERRTSKKDDGAEPPDTRRTFKAFGREVDVWEQQLDFDPTTRLLTLGGTLQEVAQKAKVDKAAAVVPVVVDHVRQNPGISQNKLREDLKKHGLSRDAAIAAIDMAISRNLVGVEVGPNNAKRHRVVGEPAPQTLPSPEEAP